VNDGVGVFKDREGAKVWLRHAADLGHGLAKARLKEDSMNCKESN